MRFFSLIVVSLMMSPAWADEACTGLEAFAGTYELDAENSTIKGVIGKFNTFTVNGCSLSSPSLYSKGFAQPLIVDGETHQDEKFENLTYRVLMEKTAGSIVASMTMEFSYSSDTTSEIFEQMVLSDDGTLNVFLTSTLPSGETQHDRLTWKKVD